MATRTEELLVTIKTKTAPPDDTDDAVAWVLACPPRFEQGSTVLETAALAVVLRACSANWRYKFWGVARPRDASGRQYRNRTCFSCESNMRSAIELTACLSNMVATAGFEPASPRI